MDGDVGIEVPDIVDDEGHDISEIIHEMHVDPEGTS